MYASDPKTFAANLRAMGCPEETVKDIILADISRQFQDREANLRPKPADHVPITWAPNPPERKLFQRRQEAALIAREKAVAMRNALGYNVPVTKPVYSLTTDEQQFENSLASLPPQHRHAAANAHEQYLAGVQMLCDRTQGFWLAEDLAELDQLKAERRNELDKLTATP